MEGGTPTPVTDVPGTSAAGAARPAPPGPRRPGPIRPPPVMEMAGGQGGEGMDVEDVIRALDLDVEEEADAGPTPLGARANAYPSHSKVWTLVAGSARCSRRGGAPAFPLGRAESASRPCGRLSK